MADSVYPSAETPAIFADGVLNVARMSGIVRFYLGRQDPDAVADGKARSAIVGQVIMPVRSFMETAMFFRLTLDEMVAKGTVTAAELEEISKALKGDADATDGA